MGLPFSRTEQGRIYQRPFGGQSKDFGKHSTSFRLVYQAGVLAVLFAYVAWALQLFWSVG